MTEKKKSPKKPKKNAFSVALHAHQKKVKEHQAKGGKSSDLPPPPKRSDFQ